MNMNIHYDEDWEKTMHESDPELWSKLTEEADNSNSTKEPDLILDSDTGDVVIWNQIARH